MAWCRRRCIEMLGGFVLRKRAATVLESNWEKKPMLSGLIRRNYANLAPIAGEEKGKKGTMKEEILKSKSLYLCFEERIHPRESAHVIKSIKLSQLLAAPNDGAELKLEEVAYTCGPDTEVPFLIGTRLIGSKIIFSGGVVVNRDTDFIPLMSNKEIWEFETNPSIDANPRILQPSQVYKTTCASGSPFLEEIAGQVYCLRGRGLSGSIEVFDKTQEKWLPLQVPPGKHQKYAAVGNKLLVWSPYEAGVIGLDLTQPEKGWTEQDPSLGSHIPYLFNGAGNDKLVVKLNSDDPGHGFLLFSCDSKQPLTVKVFHVSHHCDSMKPMKPLQLPELPPTFHDVLEECMFFHLEDNKVGLVLYRDRIVPHTDSDSDYDYDDGDGDGGEEEDAKETEETEEEETEEMKEDLEQWAYDDSRERIHVIVFEYEIAEKSMDIKYKFLTARCLEYSTRNPPEGVTKSSSHLNGAYVI